MTRTILLVDDDATQLKLGKLRLRHEGFEVVTALGGDEALGKLRVVVPDVIMSDVLMSDLDGFALCRRLRAKPQLAKVPIILMSAHYQNGPDQELARSVGAFALVARTPDFTAEMAALGSALDARHTPMPARVVAPVPVAEAVVYESHARAQSVKVAQLLGLARNAEQRYQALFETARDGIALLTEDGRIIEVNARWPEMIGIPADELLGRHIGDFAAPGHEATNVAGFSSAIRSDGRSIGTIQHRDGRVLHIEFSSSRIVVDGQPIVVQIAHDVTAIVEAARSVAATEHRYRSLIERLPDVIWTMTDAGSMVFVTQNALAVTGYTAEELLSESAERRGARIHPDDALAVHMAFRAFGERGERFDLEYRHRRPDGGWAWHRNRATARYIRDGVTYLEGMLTDVTERKQLEQEFRQAQKMEAIGQLTGGIAHDFNNILSAILASAQFLAEDLAVEDPRREDALAIESAAQRATALTRQLLAFSRRQVLEPKNVSIDKSVVAMEPMLRRLIARNIELEVRSQPDLAAVRVDESQLEQVVMNLVVNARDAMPSGGRIVIETVNRLLDETAGAQINVPPGRYTVLSVRDTGTGIDIETQRRMFEPFFTTKPVGKGTGLGLSTCYGIVKQSGGFIGVVSELGRGTSFSVYLPSIEAVRSVEPEIVDAGELRGTETVLLVEDDERTRGVVHRILLARGYNVLIASTGVEAIELAASTRGPIHVLITDVVMPLVSGQDVARALRAQRPNLIVILISGQVLETPPDPTMQFMQKPFTQAALARKLREVLTAPV